MNGRTILYIDQHGSKFWANLVKSLVEQIGGGRVSKMLRDKQDGRTVHTGYVIGQHWLSAFVPVELSA